MAGERKQCHNGLFSYAIIKMETEPIEVRLNHHRASSDLCKQEEVTMPMTSISERDDYSKT